jgi:hypothetical protein
MAPGASRTADILVCIVERMWVVAQKTLDHQTFDEEGFYSNVLQVGTSWPAAIAARLSKNNEKRPFPTISRNPATLW